MELKGIKNIIFDLGGVLLNLNFNNTQQAFIDLGIKDFDRYYTKAKQTGIFDQYETGKVTEDVFCDDLRDLTGLDASDQQIIAAWNAMLLDFPMIRKQLLLNLKEQFNTSLLSNTNETHINAFNKIIAKDIQETSLAPLFHSHFFSNEIALRKPDVKTFEFVLTENDFKPQETLFLDDSIQHIEGAKKAGIHTLHITDTPVEVLFADFLT